MLTSMGDIMREAYRRGWITTRDGNISIRRDDKFYITPSGVRKPIIVPEMIIKGRFQNNQLIQKTPGKASGELEMHVMLQTTACFKGIRAIVHLHPTNIVAFLHKGGDLQQIAAEFPEVSRYTKVGPSVPVVPVTSTALAIATHEAMTEPVVREGRDGFDLKYDIVGQKNHGVCAVGVSPWDAFEHIERLEHVCEMALKAGR